MKTKIAFGLTLIILASLIGGVMAPSPLSPRQAGTYVDPALLAVADGTISAIVTGTDSQEAARAVEHFGGRVTSNLWLIDAVAAALPADQVKSLAAYPGIRSVVMNKSVKASDWNGYVTDIRIMLSTYMLEGNQIAPAAFLPDGGFVSFSDNGKLLIVNADGTERARVTLPGGGVYSTAPAIGADGTIYIANQSLRIYALNPDGSTRWEFRTTGGNKFLGGVVLAPNGTVYAADDGRSVYALDGPTGQKLWQFKANTGSGIVLTTPIVGPDGVLYFDTDKGYVYAVAPNGSLKWAYNTAAPLKFSPFLGPNGMVYVASTDGKKLFALEAATGAKQYVFVTSSKIMAQPTLGTDGSIYIPTEDRTLYGLNPDGAQRFMFRPASGHFRTSPLVSADGATVYAAIEEKILFAVDTATGALRWSYTTLGNIKSGPALDVDGGVIIGSEGTDLVRLRADGTVSFKKLFVETAYKITQSAATDQSGRAAVRFGTNNLAVISRLRNQWDGRPDVQATDNRRTWKLVNPVAIDVGADVLHKQEIDGSGVTVAVVDSGVYFDGDVKLQLGTQVQRLFLGQADYMEPTCPVSSRSLTQYDDYCWYDWSASDDRYGHGTAVAGIIWNNFRDYDTNVYLGIAPGAKILSVRVLDHDGAGSYETVIKGIQYVVANKAQHNIRVMNLSLSGYATVPYFVDPLNRAVEQAWANGIVVLAAAGNSGPAAETVTVPGNDPYVITVGAVNSKRTPGYWLDDVIPSWSASGPTPDGFVKPDVLAPGSNIVTFMYNDPTGVNTQKIVLLHPDYSATSSLYRMNGTSMATAVASGVAALMLQANPDLTPDQVKFRLMYSAVPAFTPDQNPVYNIFQQGAGRLWVPDAVYGAFPADGSANSGMDLAADLAHGYETDADLAYHYQGTIAKVLSDDGQTYLYYVDNPDGSRTALGAARVSDMTWLSAESLAEGTTWAGGQMAWAGGQMAWAGGQMAWAGGQMAWAGGQMAWAGGQMAWAGGQMAWAGGQMAWAGGRMAWAGGQMAWAGDQMAWAGGRMAWAGMTETYAGGQMAWAGAVSPGSNAGATAWVGDW